MQCPVSLDGRHQTKGQSSGPKIGPRKRHFRRLDASLAKFDGPNVPWDQPDDQWTLHQSLIAGIDRRGCAVSSAGLDEDVADVAPHRVEADHQLVRDLLVALAGGNQTQDLDLARGEAG